MLKESHDHTPLEPDGAISREDQSANESFETDRLDEASCLTAKYEEPAPTTVQDSNGPYKRKDKGHLHATRHAVLSRYPLEALRSLGEDVKKFRRLEHSFRKTLKPVGEIAGMLFDRFFSSYLRCILAARVEASSVAPIPTSSKPSSVLPLLDELDVPTLVFPNREDPSIHAALPTDIFRELVLIQRYDRHFSREMFRTLSLLIVLRDSGEEGLQQRIGQILGASKQQGGV